MIDSTLVIDALESMAQFGVLPANAVDLFDIGTREYLSFFEQEVIDSLISQGGATCRFFEGAYGSGKTHLLQILGNKGLKKGMVVTSTDLSQAMGLNDWRLITLYILQNMQAEIDGEVVRSLPEIVERYGQAGKANVARLRNAKLPHSGFQSAMAFAARRDSLSDSSWDRIMMFLLGNRVPVSELKKHGIQGIKNPLSQRNAEQVLRTILAGLYHLGFKGTMLLFDENERTLRYTGRNPARSNLIAANLIKRLIDGCTTGLLVGTITIFAVLPGFLENCNMVYPALGQRLHFFRGGLTKPAWRYTVLPVHYLNTVREPEDFLRNATELIVSLVEDCGGNTSGLLNEMFKHGKVIIESNVGTGYKRELMKALSALAANRINMGV